MLPKKSVLKTNGAQPSADSPEKTVAETPHVAISDGQNGLADGLSARACKIFIKNLDHEVDLKEISDAFSCFGKIVSCNVPRDAKGMSRGFGFVQFDRPEFAHAAVIRGNIIIHNRTVRVFKFLPPSEFHTWLDREELSNLYRRNDQGDWVPLFSKN